MACYKRDSSWLRRYRSNITAHTRHRQSLFTVEVRYSAKNHGCIGQSLKGCDIGTGGKSAYDHPSQDMPVDQACLCSDVGELYTQVKFCHPTAHAVFVHAGHHGRLSPKRIKNRTEAQDLGDPMTMENTSSRFDSKDHMHKVLAYIQRQKTAVQTLALWRFTSHLKMA